MVIEDKTYSVTLKGNTHYLVVAKDVEEGIQLIKAWCPTEEIIDIHNTGNLVITRDIIKQSLKEELLRNGSCG